MKQTWKKLLSIGAALAISLSSLSVFMLSAAADVSATDVQTAAKLYVQAYKNNATKEGLLQYVQTAVEDTSITLADADFFIKHAVPGVTDVMADGSTNEYPLNIEGSNGAVAAIFGVGNERVTVACPFENENEVIKVEKVAVADKTLQDTTYFTYDGNGNITAFKGGADKIVIPADFPGAFECDCTSAGNDSTYDNVKVMIVNNQKPLGNRAYYSWNNLIAFQMADSDTGWDVFPKPGGNNNGLGGGWMQFGSCKKLKYVKFPSKIGTSGSSWWTAFSQYIFDSCVALENVNLPILSGSAKREMKKMEFRGTGVRDFFFPETYYYNAANEASQQVFASPSFTEGTRNLFLYTDEMTYTRAVALAVAEGSELMAVPGKSTDDIMAGMKAAITGSANAAALADTISITLADGAVSTDAYDSYTITISNGSDAFALSKTATKALSGLEIAGCELSPAFNPSVLEYTVMVSGITSSVNVNATAVNGATVGTITGADALSTGENTITIPVTTIEDKAVVYTVKVTRAAISDKAEAIREAFEAYVQKNKNVTTKEALLTYVQTAVEDTTITLADDDFFIKHAIPGVTDVMADGSNNEYPLNIEGSYGAVAAVFKHNGASVGVSCAFENENEVIKVEKVAVADKTLQDTTYFTYDANGNITEFKGGADKIVIPADFPGALETDCKSNNVGGNDGTYDNVKVLIINNQKPLGNRAIYNWENLIAFQMADSDTGWDVFPKPGGNNNGLGGGWMQFAQCKKLKYVKFPSKISASNSSWWTAFSDYCFEGCTALENVNLPEFTAGGANRTIRKMAFKGTAVRDFFFPAAYTYDPAAEATQQVFTSPSFTEGTRNLFLYTDEMTFVRAAALATAEAGELFAASSKTVTEVLADMKSAITGSVNAAELANAISISQDDDVTSTDFADNGVINMVYGADTISMAFSKVKTLLDLSVEGYSISPKFDASVLEYTLKVDNSITSVQVNATTMSGASVVISGNDALVEGDNAVKVKVTTEENKEVTYTITVTRDKAYSLEDLGKAIADAVATGVWTNRTEQGAVIEYLTDAIASTGWKLGDVVEFYKHRAVDGAKDGDEIMVPAYDGYIAMVVKVSKGNENGMIPVLCSILGQYKVYNFTEDDISKDEDMHLSPDGKVLEWYSGDAKKVVIPDGVEEIEMDWYDGDHPDEVVALILPESVEALPQNLAYGMTGLEVCYIGNKPYEVPGGAFDRCYFLQYIHISDNTELIGSNAFRFTTVLDMHLPDSIIEVGRNAFWCSGMKNFTFSKDAQSFANDAIVYPVNNIGVWNNATSSADYPYPGNNEGEGVEGAGSQRLLAILKERDIDKNPVVITLLGTDFDLMGPAFGTNSAQSTVLATRVFIRAAAELEDTTFKDKISPNNVYNGESTYQFGLDMMVTESAARAQYKADNMPMSNASTADVILQTLKDSVMTTTVEMKWKSAPTITPATSTATGSVNGIVTVTDGNVSFDIVVNRVLDPEEDTQSGNNNNNNNNNNNGSNNDNQFGSNDDTDIDNSNNADNTSPETGDKSYVVTAMVVLVASAFALAMTAMKKKRGEFFR